MGRPSIIPPVSDSVSAAEFEFELELGLLRTVRRGGRTGTDSSASMISPVVAINPAISSACWSTSLFRS